MFKTLMAEVDGALGVAVVPVVAQLDLKALAAAADGKRACLADPAAAERSSGYVVGGISPLGQRKRLPTVIDETACCTTRSWSVAAAVAWTSNYPPGAAPGLGAALAGWAPWTVKVTKAPALGSSIVILSEHE